MENVLSCCSIYCCVLLCNITLSWHAALRNNEDGFLATFQVRHCESKVKPRLTGKYIQCMYM